MSLASCWRCASLCTSPFTSICVPSIFSCPLLICFSCGPISFWTFADQFGGVATLPISIWSTTFAAPYVSRRRCSTAAFVASSATLPPATTWPGVAFAGGGDDTVAPAPAVAATGAAVTGAASGTDLTGTPPASIGVTVAGPTLSARAAPPSASAANASAKRRARSRGRRGFVISSRSGECFAERVDAHAKRQLRLIEITDELADPMVVLRMCVDPFRIVDVDVVFGVSLRIDHAVQGFRGRAVEADDEPLALGDRADEDRELEIGARHERRDEFEPECGDEAPVERIGRQRQREAALDVRRAALHHRAQQRAEREHRAAQLHRMAAREQHLLEAEQGLVFDEIVERAVVRAARAARVDRHLRVAERLQRAGRLLRAEERLHLRGGARPEPRERKRAAREERERAIDFERRRGEEREAPVRRVVARDHVARDRQPALRAEKREVHRFRAFVDDLPARVVGEELHRARDPVVERLQQLRVVRALHEVAARRDLAEVGDLGLDRLRHCAPCAFDAEAAVAATCAAAAPEPGCAVALAAPPALASATDEGRRRPRRLCCCG
ncbi:hypothetical protein BURPS1710b_3634 [Burkholderia pseudomallei 1710b]|uniref:Uncharacterized protein n=1 Tax=Burkholderia pseudomallei (strain 1710b) TaxID=320372 RepID=Q3JN55_BURP1|nr:hypothetical protein BURPS1710b_3634 [Burkholderia pseudomallei 1710b]